MNLKTILLAEDNQNDIDLTILALSDYHLANNIEVVNDGVEVMEYLRFQGRFKGRNPGSPAVVLLDLKMPRMDGIEVLKEIKNDPDLKHIPVVMLTSSKEESDLIQTYKLGVNAYVVKPVDFKQFMDAIKNLGAFWALLNELP
ncbi:MAG: response regulator [Bacteroidales bacterium]|nr:response regulator [Bacteroidales bacterium]MBK8882743.1 response regulator [Bacteroidales bacterium]